ANTGKLLLPGAGPPRLNRPGTRLLGELRGPRPRVRLPHDPRRRRAADALGVGGPERELPRGARRGGIPAPVPGTPDARVRHDGEAAPALGTPRHGPREAPDRSRLPPAD